MACSICVTLYGANVKIEEFIIKDEKLIRKIARRKYIGNQYLFEYINIFDKNDLFQEIVLWLLKYKENKERDLILFDIYKIINDLIRSAKNRKRLSGNIDSFTGYGIKDSDHVEKYINFNNGIKIGNNYDLRP
jgi:hypothetical protein